MGKISVLRLNSFIAVISEAIKDLGENKWWLEENTKIGVPIERLQELKEFLISNFDSITKQ